MKSGRFTVLMHIIPPMIYFHHGYSTFIFVCSLFHLIFIVLNMHSRNIFLYCFFVLHFHIWKWRVIFGMLLLLWITRQTIFSTLDMNLKRHALYSCRASQREQWRKKNAIRNIKSCWLYNPWEFHNAKLCISTQLKTHLTKWNSFCLANSSIGFFFSSCCIFCAHSKALCWYLIIHTHILTTKLPTKFTHTLAYICSKSIVLLLYLLNRFTEMDSVSICKLHFRRIVSKAHFIIGFPIQVLSLLRHTIHKVSGNFHMKYG